MARDLGRIIEEAVLGSDEEGRIHLNPILAEIKAKVGVECRIDNFKTKLRATLLDTMAKQLKKDVSKIYTTVRGNTPLAGTW